MESNHDVDTHLELSERIIFSSKIHSRQEISPWQPHELLKLCSLWCYQEAAFMFPLKLAGIHGTWHDRRIGKENPRHPK